MSAEISENRFLFTQSLGFIPRSEHKGVYIAREALKLIPIISIFAQGFELRDTLEKKDFYRSHRYTHVWDVRFSDQSIAVQIINLLGLGILILPFRLVATYLHHDDNKNGRKHPNPHRLEDVNLMICTESNKDQDVYYNVILCQCPGSEDYAQRMAYRDNIQFPEYLCRSLYPDPFAKDSDRKIKEKIEEYVKPFRYDFHQRLRNLTRRRNE
jgi:hypothetical protein